MKDRKSSGRAGFGPGRARGRAAPASRMRRGGDVRTSPIGGGPGRASGPHFGQYFKPCTVREPMVEYDQIHRLTTQSHEGIAARNRESHVVGVTKEECEDIPNGRVVVYRKDSLRCCGDPTAFAPGKNETRGHRLPGQRFQNTDAPIDHHVHGQRERRRVDSRSKNIDPPIGFWDRSSVDSDSRRLRKS